MASRPTTIPQLDTSKTNRVAPVAGKITSGYVLNDLFPSSNANYLHGWAGDWHEWLQERSEDGTTPGTDLTLRGLDALTATGDGGVLTLKGGDGGSTSGDGGDIVLLPGDVTSGAFGKVGVGRTPVWANFEVAGNGGQSNVALFSNGGVSAYSEIGFMSYIDPNFYAEWYMGVWGYQHSTNPGKFYLLHQRNVAGSVIGTIPLIVTDDDKIGLGDDVTSPLGTVHIRSGLSGVPSANTDADDLFIENSDNAGITLASPNNKVCSLFFADPQSSAVGGLAYSHVTNLLGIWVNDGAYSLTLNSSGQVGIGKTATTPLDVNGHILAAAVAANTSGVDSTGTGTGYGVKGTAGDGSVSAGVYGAGHGTTNNSGVRGLGGGTNGIGVWGDGKGSGAGVYGSSASGGTGHGVQGISLNATGAGVRGEGFGVGTGVYGEAGGTAGSVGVGGIGGGGGGIGVQGTGTANYAGVNGIGGPTSGVGVNGTGGATSGTGIKGTGGSTNGVGVEGQGTGTGSGVEGTGDATGDGVTGTGGSAGGVGVKGTGGGGAVSHGVQGLGGSSGGYGGQFAAQNTGETGCEGVGATNGAGVEGQGTGTGSGVIGSGGSTGYGVEAIADATSPVRSALRLVPQDTDPTTALQGDLYVNSSDSTLRVYTGASWVKVGTQT
jgi:hypothetical protein